VLSVAAAAYPRPLPSAAEEARELVKRYDVNGDNQIDYAEFLQVLMYCFCTANVCQCWQDVLQVLLYCSCTAILLAV
jgi:hypothetical protein